MKWAQRGMQSGLIGISLILSLTVGLPALAEAPAATKGVACVGDNDGLTLPLGFCATVFADKLGYAGHMAIAPNGTLYVNTTSDRDLKPHFPSPPGGFVVALRDTKGTGQADYVVRFGVTSRQGGRGGSGIALHENAVYAEENGRILRYVRIAGEAVPSQPPVVVVSGLPSESAQQAEHPIAIDGKGTLTISAGAGGLLRFDATKNAQTISPADLHAISLRDANGLAFDAGGRLFAVHKGELVKLPADTDPPGPKPPVATLPGEMMPKAVAIYQGADFPVGYRGGAFIALQSARHGSASDDQDRVVFQPMVNGKSSAPSEIFAHGFKLHRPSGLAIGPDGALFVSDGAQGRVWRITYSGSGAGEALPTVPAAR